MMLWLLSMQLQRDRPMAKESPEPPAQGRCQLRQRRLVEKLRLILRALSAAQVVEAGEGAVVQVKMAEAEAALLQQAAQVQVRAEPMWRLHQLPRLRLRRQKQR